MNLSRYCLKRRGMMQTVLERMMYHFNTAESTTTSKYSPLLHYLIEGAVPLWIWQRTLLGMFVQVWLRLLCLSSDLQRIQIPSWCWTASLLDHSCSSSGSRSLNDWVSIRMLRNGRVVEGPSILWEHQTTAVSPNADDRTVVPSIVLANPPQKRDVVLAYSTVMVSPCYLHMQLQWQIWLQISVQMERHSWCMSCLSTQWVTDVGCVGG